MNYLLVFALLLLLELVYFRLADRYNIIDKPNFRSSHTRITLRGGGVLFPVSLAVYFLVSGFRYPYFMAGLLMLAAISFADDVKHQSRALRFGVHIVAIALLLYQADALNYPWLWVIIAFVLCIGIINAYNFMDGINGITSGYALVIIAGLWLANRMQNFIDPAYLVYLTIGAIIFSWFNFRKRARCFAGDVGSVSMAFALLFPTLLLVEATGNLLFILFFALYGVDTVLTIFHRLYKKENILDAHRQHLFQYLANEAGLPHLAVTSIYMVLQLLINFAVIYLWQHASVLGQWAFGLSTLLFLTVVHIILKFRIMSNAGMQMH